MILPAVPGQYPRLLAIWESAVHATHDFLRREDFDYYKARMPEYFGMVRLFVYRDVTTGTLTGFLGITDKQVQMLFVDEAARGKGVGKQLLEHAVTLGCDAVDVNEQNIQAIGFYLHQRFEITGRAATDGAGKPYPLLHLKKVSAS
ncbi:GNAT family N-acetyltransferase [Niabella beijingensis]|uniref:GNAT family N-acetyltransferase n=1 Tax=Niabella beijingensis TaxID=2872700 RepID=UPI001CC0E201|nr:GNAT family N-acetyltransferase [Niabella beijingensis]MBZ4190458.1 GNAT family N-acetyltransferase [Niabella beijingensis]